MSSKTLSGKARFLRYYCDQQALIDTDDISKFEKIIDDPLPTTFWVSPCCPVNEITKELKNCIPSTGESPLEMMTWQNDFKAFSIKIPRKELRKCIESQKLHDLLRKYSEVGIIWRQEEVSMLPPLFLNVQRGDRILDMCAAPGSKTGELLALLGEKNWDGSEESVLSARYDASAGYVVANDSNCKRLDMLIHRVKRMSKYFPYAIFTNHDARFFPDQSRRSLIEKEESGIEHDLSKTGSFNKIIIDVPCTGDGTIRKNIHALRDWHEFNAYLLNPMQLDIALKAAYLLEVDGLMVYSTCSLNPIENEAVVHSLLKICEGSLALVPPSEYSMVTLIDEPGKFRIRPGVSTWLANFSLYEEKLKRKSSLFSQERLFDSYSPPREKENTLRLENTMRIYPHLQNTGGFFIAVLKKEKPLPKEVEKIISSRFASQHLRQEGTPDRKSQYVPVSMDLVKRLSEFYSVSELTHLISCGKLLSLRRELHASEGSTQSIACFIPNEPVSKNINFVAKSVFNVLEEIGDHWNIVNVGLRMFSIDRPSKNTEKFPWRISNECVQMIFAVIKVTPKAHESIFFSCASATCRILPLKIGVARELLHSPGKSMKLGSFLDMIGYKQEIPESFPAGGLIFLIHGQTSPIRAFSGILTKYSIQASISNQDLPVYHHALKESC